MIFKTGTLVEVGVAASFTGHRLGWVVRPCTKDGGTIVYIAGDELPYHEYCVKETDFIEPVKKRVNLSGEAANKS